MSDNFSALGFLVQTPWGPRKSGMPDSVEMPAPVSTTTRCDCPIQSRAASMRSFIALFYKKAPVATILTAQQLRNSFRLVCAETLLGERDITRADSDSEGILKALDR